MYKYAGVTSYMYIIYYNTDKEMTGEHWANGLGVVKATILIDSRRTFSRLWVHGQSETVVCRKSIRKYINIYMHALI